MTLPLSASLFGRKTVPLSQGLKGPGMALLVPRTFLLVPLMFTGY